MKVSTKKPIIKLSKGVETAIIDSMIDHLINKRPSLSVGLCRAYYEALNLHVDIVYFNTLSSLRVEGLYSINSIFNFDLDKTSFAVSVKHPMDSSRVAIFSIWLKIQKWAPLFGAKQSEAWWWDDCDRNTRIRLLKFVKFIYGLKHYSN